MTQRFAKVGLVGAGLVGRGWAIVFARAGRQVNIFDASENIRHEALGKIKANVVEMQSIGLVEHVDEILSNICVVDTLDAAVADADYIQESVFERVDIKTEISADIGALLRKDVIVGSSSSGIPAARFTETIKNRSRFLVVHPVNPPHLIPLVELVPAPWTDAEIVPLLKAMMEDVGQFPIVVNQEIEGFVLNRLQGALLNEAWALYSEGVASLEDIDKTVAYGLGLRWAFMGPFQTIDLNAPGGIEDYARRLGPLYHSIHQSRRDQGTWSAEAISRAAEEMRQKMKLSELDKKMEWRDRQLMAFASYRKNWPAQ